MCSLCLCLVSVALSVCHVFSSFFAWHSFFSLGLKIDCTSGWSEKRRDTRVRRRTHKRMEKEITRLFLFVFFLKLKNMKHLSAFKQCAWVRNMRTMYMKAVRLNKKSICTLNHSKGELRWSFTHNFK